MAVLAGQFENIVDFDEKIILKKAWLYGNITL